MFSAQYMFRGPFFVISFRKLVNCHLLHPCWNMNQKATQVKHFEHSQHIDMSTWIEFWEYKAECVSSAGKIKELFPVQVTTWNAMKGGYSQAHDFCICAPTGSGKTLAYALPILQALRGWAHLVTYSSFPIFYLNANNTQGRNQSVSSSHIIKPFRMGSANILLVLRSLVFIQGIALFLDLESLPARDTVICYACFLKLVHVTIYLYPQRTFDRYHTRLRDINKWEVEHKLSLSIWGPHLIQNKSSPA